MTLGDFWQMIWEQNVPTVVMLTQTIEGTKVKCQQYWPANDGKEMTFGNIVVTVTESNSYATFTSRNFEIREVNALVTSFTYCKSFSCKNIIHTEIAHIAKYPI